MEDKYQYTVREGDVVQMPGGTVGIVTKVEFDLGCVSKEVQIFPFTNWLHRVILSLFKKAIFFDNEINKLKLVSN
ncbi:MAG: hypothetical protein R3251_02750 [Candidatus Spechtbacterales bacterium]|nr:hypothetical protein [Candidatus Spechtbacterales bacterium]